MESIPQFQNANHRMHKQRRTHLIQKQRNKIRRRATDESRSEFPPNPQFNVLVISALAKDLLPKQGQNSSNSEYQAQDAKNRAERTHPTSKAQKKKKAGGQMMSPGVSSHRISECNA